MASHNKQNIVFPLHVHRVGRRSNPVVPRVSADCCPVRVAVLVVPRRSALMHRTKSKVPACGGYQRVTDCNQYRDPYSQTIPHQPSFLPFPCSPTTRPPPERHHPHSDPQTTRPMHVHEHDQPSFLPFP